LKFLNMMEEVMTEELRMKQELLVDIYALGAEMEEKGIAKPPPLDHLLRRAQELGIGIDAGADATLDDLRTAVEAACEQGSQLQTA
jgi:hypothetical protein